MSHVNTGALTASNPRTSTTGMRLAVSVFGSRNGRCPDLFVGETDPAANKVLVRGQMAHFTVSQLRRRSQ